MRRKLHGLGFFFARGAPSADDLFRWSRGVLTGKLFSPDLVEESWVGLHVLSLREVRVENLVKRYGGLTAVDARSFKVEEGQSVEEGDVLVVLE